MIQFENTVKRYRSIILNDLNKDKINCWIAGGTLRDYFMGIPIKSDIDIFFPDEKNYKKARKHFMNNRKAKVIWESENGVKLEDKNGQVFDLVKKFFKDPEETIKAFDFTVSMLAVDMIKVYHGKTTFIDLAKRQLMINKITYPASTMSRAFRYYKKGFLMCQDEMKKIVLAIQDMPKENKSDNKEADDLDSSSSGDSMFIGID